MTPSLLHVARGDAPSTNMVLVRVADRCSSTAASVDAPRTEAWLRSLGALVDGDLLDAGGPSAG